jgi:hypothetical protein
MEADLGESIGALELFSELQSESFDETQANTFRNDPTSIDEDTLKRIPETLEQMREKMVSVKALCESRQVSIDNLDASISALCLDVGENKNAYRNSSLLQHPQLSMKKIDAIKMFETQLVALRERRGVTLHDLANKLRTVWDQLDIPIAYRETFCKKNEGRSMEVIRACEDELKRVEILKQARIHELILLLRDRIHRAWDELSVPLIERKFFEDRYDYVAESTFSDETLEAHKVLANNLESMVLLAEPLIAKIKEHMSLLEEKAKYDELTKNGDRLRDRKYNMSKEEKLRKRVDRLPDVTDVLIIELTKWKVTNRNQPLIYSGQDYLQYLLDEKARVEEEKAQRLEEKRRGLTSAPSSAKFSKISPNLNASSSNSTASSSTKSTAAALPAMTPSRLRSTSARTPAPAAPATTGKPVGTRPRTNTADGSKSISSVANGVKENANNK